MGMTREFRSYRERVKFAQFRGATFDLIVVRLCEDEAFASGLEDAEREHKARHFAQIAVTAMNDVFDSLHKSG